MTPRANDLYAALIRVLYGAAAFVLLFWLLDEILLGVMFGLTALIFAVALNPPVLWLEEKGMPRPVAALLVCGLLGACAALLLALVVPRVYADTIALIKNLPGYFDALQTYALRSLAGHPEIQARVREIDLQFILDKSLPAAGKALAGIGIVSLSLVGLTLVLILLASTIVFILAHPRPLLQGYLTAMPERLRDPSARAFARGSDMVYRWLLSNLIVGGIEGIASAAFLTFLGIPGGILWGVLTFFSEQIPKLGPYVMTVPPLLVALVLDPVKALWVFLFFVALNEFTGLVIGPLIRSRQMKLHPASLIFAVVVMGGAFGLLGALIATPLAGIVKAYYEEFYLSRQPEDPRLDERVEAMLRREVPTTT
jgi:putative permease